MKANKRRSFVLIRVHSRLIPLFVVVPPLQLRSTDLKLGFWA
jgi:hypothetical protein